MVGGVVFFYVILNSLSSITGTRMLPRRFQIVFKSKLQLNPAFIIIVFHLCFDIKIVTKLVVLLSKELIKKATEFSQPTARCPWGFTCKGHFAFVLNDYLRFSLSFQTFVLASALFHYFRCYTFCVHKRFKYFVSKLRFNWEFNSIQFKHTYFCFAVRRG